MTCVEGLKQVEGFSPANLTDNDAVGPVAKRGFEQVPDGDCRDSVLLSAGLEANENRFVDLDFGGVFDQHDAFFVGDESGEDIQESGLTSSGPAADEQVDAIFDLFSEQAG